MSHRVTGVPSGRNPAGPHLLRLVATLLLAMETAPPVFAKDEAWRQEGAAAFAKAHREGVVVSDTGAIRLGHAIHPLGSIGAERVWDLARGPSGTIYAATGDSGKVFRLEPGNNPAWTLAHDAAESQVLSLAIAADQVVFAGTGPTGQVINLTDPKHPASRPGPGVQYVWDLAIDSMGTLFAATGPNGQLWKRSGDKPWSLVLDSKAPHLLCLAIGPDGSVYAGSDGEGLVYRVAADGKVSIVFDAPQSEIRALTWGGDGALYAGTAAESGGSSGGNRSSMFLTQAVNHPGSDGPGGDREPNTPVMPPDAEPEPAVLFQTPPAPSGPRASPARGPQGGAAAPRPIAAGDNAVYRIDTDGVPREVLRVKALVHALAWAHDRLLVGTGPDGQLYEVRNRGEETAPLAKLDRGQILSLLPDASGGVLMGTGDPGSVVQLAAGHIAAGRLESEVHDTRLVSRFGAIHWRGDQPPGTAIALEARTGNVGEPDETWTPWSPEQRDHAPAALGLAPGRFVQYRARLTTNDARHSPELRSISVSFRTANLAPEITRLDIPDLSTADGALRQVRLNVRWDVTDPNDDDLAFSLKIRKEGWPDWIAITEEPVTEKTFAWDTSAFPSGLYRLKLIASDRPSNGPDEALTRDRESLTFVVDHDAPRVAITTTDRRAAIVLSDDFTRLVKADYSVDGGPRHSIFPVDGLFDSPRETIQLALPDLKKGIHLIMIRATDAAGNVGNSDALTELKE